MAVEVERRLFTVEEFGRLIRIGVLGADERVELINGALIRMPQVGSHHQGHVGALEGRFRDLLGGRISVSVQEPVVLGEGRRMRPDLALLRPREDHDVSALPTVADIVLLIEVADATPEYDRQIKGPPYAQTGVADYWIVNLMDDQLLVFREPSPTGYASVQTLGRGDSVTLLAFPDLTVNVSDILI